ILPPWRNWPPRRSPTIELAVPRRLIPIASEVPRHEAFPGRLRDAPASGAGTSTRCLPVVSGKPRASRPPIQASAPRPADLLGPCGAGVPRGRLARGRRRDLVLDRLARRVQWPLAPSVTLPNKRLERTRRMIKE